MTTNSWRMSFPYCKSKEKNWVENDWVSFSPILFSWYFVDFCSSHHHFLKDEISVLLPVCAARLSVGFT